MRAIASPAHHWPRIDARLRYLAASVAIIVSYIAAGELARQLHELAGPMGTIWVPSGLGLAVILFDGPRWWPGVAVGTFLGVLMRQHPAEALIVTATEVLEALAAYYFLRGSFGFRVQLDRVRDVAGFAAIELATLFAGATLGAISFVALGLTDVQHLFRLWTTWWWIGVSSDLILTPALLTWAAKSAMPHIDRRRIFPRGSCSRSAGSCCSS